MEREANRKSGEESATVSRGEVGTTRRSVLIGASVAGIAASLPSLIQPALAQAPKRGGTIRVAFTGTPSKLDPHTIVGTEEIAIIRSLYDSLVWTDHTLTARPELATAWESTPDAKTWTFQLRKGVKFHHGREMTADDVVWSYRRVLDPATASPARAVFSFVESITKVDDYTVRFTLNGPFADFPILVGGSFQARIAPRDVSDLQRNPVGTGPFKLREFVPGDRTSLVRNEAYWRDGQPYIDRVDFLTIPEEAGHVAALIGGSIDISWSPATEVLPIYQANKDINVLQVPTNGYQPIVMAVDMPPFNDKRVREAFRLICDRAALKRIVLGDLNVELSNDHPIPPSSPYYMQQTPAKQDIDRAKALLADAGYKNGMDIEMVANTGRPGLVQTALAYQDMAKKANVRIAVKSVTSDTFLSSYWLKHNFYVTQWNARTTLYELLAIAYKSDAKWNETHWKTPEMDGFIEAIRSEQNEEKRKTIFGEIQKLFAADVPTIIPYHKPRVTAVRKHVQGFQAHPAAWVDLRTAWLS